MIITVPESKKLRYIKQTSKPLNESLFDDSDDIFSGTSELTVKINKKYEEETVAPRVLKFLDEYDVMNYEIKCTGTGVLVDVHDHLYLPNKKLDRTGKGLFEFDVVDGNCNFTGNNLTDWSWFPNVIKGNCYANFNKIRNFDGVPVIQGKLIASKQNIKTQYPLTHENYVNFKQNKITENSVYAIPVNRVGLLCSISEDNNSCIVKFDDGIKQEFRLNECEYLGTIENLLI